VARVEITDDGHPTAAWRRRLRLAHADRANGNGSEGDGEHAVVTRVKQRVSVQRLRLWPVARVAVVFWTCVGVMLSLATIVTWALLSSAGVVSNFEKFVEDITGVKDFRVMSGTIILMLVLLVCLFVIVATTLTVVGAAFYNLVSRTIGSIEFDSAIDVRTTAIAEPQPAQQPAGARSNGHAEGTVVLKS
jgi:transmembrane protein DUF3566